MTEDPYHLDLQQRLIAVIQEISGLAAIDPDDTEEQLACHPQSHGSLCRHNDLLHALGEVRLQNMLLGQLALQVGRQPDAGQRPGLLKEFFGVEHGRDGGATGLMEHEEE